MEDGFLFTFDFIDSALIRVKAVEVLLCGFNNDTIEQGHRRSSYRA